MYKRENLFGIMVLKVKHRDGEGRQPEVGMVAGTTPEASHLVLQMGN